MGVDMPPPKNGLLTRLAVSLAIVGTIASGIWSLELRYAKAADLVAHVVAHREEAREFSVEILESRRQAIRSRLFEMEQRATRQRGGLTWSEQENLDRERQQYQATMEKIERLTR